MNVLRLSLLAVTLATLAARAQVEPGGGFSLPDIPQVQPLNNSGNNIVPTIRPFNPDSPPIPVVSPGGNGTPANSNTSKIKPVQTTHPMGAGTTLKNPPGSGAKAPPGAAGNSEDCQLVAINDAARQHMHDMSTEMVNILFNDPDFRAGLEASAKSGGKCVADVTRIWENLSGSFKMGGNWDNFLDQLKNFKPMDLLKGMVDQAIEEACQMAKREVMGMFGKVTDLLSQRVNLGPLGGVSTNALIRYDGSATFDINAHGPSTSSINSYFENLWK